MPAVIGREICGWPNIGPEIRLAGRTYPQNSAEGSTISISIKNSKWRRRRHFEFAFLRSSLMDLKWHSRFGVNRTLTFEDIVILKFCKFGLKRPFRPQDLHFGGFNP